MLIICKQGSKWVLLRVYNNFEYTDQPVCTSRSTWFRPLGFSLSGRRTERYFRRNDGKYERGYSDQQPSWSKKKKERKKLHHKSINCTDVWSCYAIMNESVCLEVHVHYRNYSFHNSFHDGFLITCILFWMTSCCLYFHCKINILVFRSKINIYFRKQVRMIYLREREREL